jgi:hypothetical protein
MENNINTPALPSSEWENNIRAPEISSPEYIAILENLGCLLKNGRTIL